MPLKIVRQDITKMNTEAIVNTAGETPEVGAGCDMAIYKAAGYEKLHQLREKIGYVAEGEVFITPGFDLPAKYIIHAVSPYYIDGSFGEEEKLRNCYRKSLILAKENGIKSISFPLIATGSFGYPRPYGLRIAVDEINTFLLDNEMEIYLVVFDSATTELAEKIYPQIEAFIKHADVCKIREEEYGDAHFNSIRPEDERYAAYANRAFELDKRLLKNSIPSECEELDEDEESLAVDLNDSNQDELDFDYGLDFDEIKKRIGHASDPFGVYILYLSERKGISLTTIESTVAVSKSVVHNIRKKPETYKPDKRTAFQLCVGLELSLDDTKDLLSRAGYAISPSLGEDRIWEFFIRNEHYDAFDISDTLEHFGFKPFIEEF